MKMILFFSISIAEELNSEEIYSVTWEQNDDDIEYISWGFEEVKKFYQQAASKNQCVIQFLDWYFFKTALS